MDIKVALSLGITTNKVVSELEQKKSQSQSTRVGWVKKESGPSHVTFEQMIS